MGISRRGALKALVAGGVGVGTGTLAYGAAYERHHVRRLTLDLPVTGLPRSFDGVRVGLITDIHHSETVSAEAVSRAVSLLQESPPDFVVLGGDYVWAGCRSPGPSRPRTARRVRRPRQSR